MPAGWTQLLSKCQKLVNRNSYCHSSWVNTLKGSAADSKQLALEKCVSRSLGQVSQPEGRCVLSPFVWVSRRVLKTLCGDFHVFPLLQVRTWWSPNPLHNPLLGLLFQVWSTTQAYSWRSTKVFLKAGANLSPLLLFPKPLPVPLGCHHSRSHSVLNRCAKAPCASCHRCVFPV